MLEYNWHTSAHAHTAFCLSQAMQFISLYKSVPLIMPTCKHKRVCPHCLSRQGGQRPRSRVTYCPQQYPDEDLNYSWAWVAVCSSGNYYYLWVITKVLGQSKISEWDICTTGSLATPGWPSLKHIIETKDPVSPPGSFSVSQQNFLMSTGPWCWEQLTNTSEH